MPKDKCQSIKRNVPIFLQSHLTEMNCTIKHQAIFFFLMDPGLLEVGEFGAANPLLDIDV